MRIYRLRSIPPLVLCAVLLLVLLATGCTTFQFTPRKPAQNAFIEQKLATISADVSEEQLVELLGPVRRRDGPYLFFDGPLHTPEETVRVTCREGRMVLLKYIHLGHFMWSRELHKETL